MSGSNPLSIGISQSAGQFQSGFHRSDFGFQFLPVSFECGKLFQIRFPFGMLKSFELRTVRVPVAVSTKRIGIRPQSAENPEGTDLSGIPVEPSTGLPLFS